MFARMGCIRRIAIAAARRCGQRRSRASNAKAVLIAVLLGPLATPTAWAGIFGPSNWYECVLDRMPGVQNDYAAAAIIKSCSDVFGDPDTSPTSTKDWFATLGSGDACVAAKALTTASINGARVIVASCHRLFDPPPPPRPEGAYIDPFAPPPDR